MIKVKLIFIDDEIALIVETDGTIKKIVGRKYKKLLNLMTTIKEEFRLSNLSNKAA